MIKRSLLGLVILGLASASAATSYKVVFHHDVTVNGSTVKAGEYKVEVGQNKATLKSGKTLIEAPVKVEDNAARFDQTAVKYSADVVDEIRIGGTHMRLVFEKSDTTASK